MLLCYLHFSSKLKFYILFYIDKASEEKKNIGTYVFEITYFFNILLQNKLEVDIF